MVTSGRARVKPKVGIIFTGGGEAPGTELFSTYTRGSLRAGPRLPLSLFRHRAQTLNPRDAS